MANRMIPKILRFFEGAGRAVSTPSGDARGHIRVYTHTTVTRGRDF